jgi:hypothetical protein
MAVEQAEQADTRIITPTEIMQTEAFQRGFEEKRAGRRPHYDNDYGDHEWEYERGRQFAVVAPANMQLKSNGQLNRKAVSLFWRLCARDEII